MVFSWVCGADTNFKLRLPYWKELLEKAKIAGFEDGKVLISVKIKLHYLSQNSLE